MALKVYIKPGAKGLGAQRAVRRLNAAVGGRAYKIVGQKANADVIIRKTPGKVLAKARRRPNTTATSYASRAPTTAAAAAKGKTVINLDPRIRQNTLQALAGATPPYPRQRARKIAAKGVVQVAAHELQHAGGVPHGMMYTGAGKLKSGVQVTRKAKKRIRRVSGMRPPK